MTVLKLDGRSFYKAFRNKESELYQAYKRGLDQMKISKEDALLQKIQEGNLTAIEIHNKQMEEAQFSNTIYDIFGI